MLSSTIRRAVIQSARTVKSYQVFPAVCNVVERQGLGHAFHNTTFATSGDLKVTEESIEHATGLELAELEGAMKGLNIFTGDDEKWLNAAKGTEEAPVVVTSMFKERIVGATDPDDDSIVEWAIVKEGEPPKLIGSEYFILKQMEGGAPAHH
mmetsp:Transcript_37525/g.52086  ORF Transcript_37525/g.52086 Transcript_37525/m.52086 type:complete len:152 (+) Transcript_37525:83-538(+)|eukprot:CAMPEP_0196580734 /NCGR_PEP_ID=MMETSP1081-20130531/30301_1 /TAXON_ID=36882 /ORGANISM="Pyramimonas amylifera, Strain CCMP720" /LENGTH=151 /DNA_ID=CAMNT_0041900691 /DNA_START=63 /DNA_END=518 /DNA_ORIENTATION=+